jgi:hypothetical protein
MSNALIENEIKYSEFMSKVEETRLIKKELVDLLFLHPIYEKAFEEDNRRKEMEINRQRNQFMRNF